MQIATIFGGYVFYIDEHNCYHRGPLTYIYVTILLITIFALLCGIMIFSSKTQSTMKATLLSFIAVLIASIIIRNYYPNSNYDFLCMSVDVLFLLIYYSHVTLRVDPLTKLLNRHVYSKMIKKINYNTVIVVIDVNEFKQINDTYGHECGDLTLKHLAHLIYKTYSKYANCFRLGGDEFCIILKPDAFDELIEETPHNDVYLMAENLMKKLDESIADQTDSGNNKGFLDYGVSQGFGVFYVESHYPIGMEKMPLQKVIELADKRMYRNKEKIKNKDERINDINGTSFTRTRVLYETIGPTIVEEEVSRTDI